MYQTIKTSESTKNATEDTMEQLENITYITIQYS